MSDRTEIRLVGRLPGFKKVSNTKLIQRETDLGLAGSKRVTDLILEGETVSIWVQSSRAATVRAELSAIGALVDEPSDGSPPS